MKRSVKLNFSPFVGNALLFLITYQLLTVLLSREDGISITFIVDAMPRWAYFLDGYILAYSIAWLQNILCFVIFMPNLIFCLAQKTNPLHIIITMGYSILLYILGLLVLLMALQEGLSLYIIPFIVAIVLYTIIAVVKIFISK